MKAALQLLSECYRTYHDIVAILLSNPKGFLKLWIKYKWKILDGDCHSVGNKSFKHTHVSIEQSWRVTWYIQFTWFQLCFFSKNRKMNEKTVQRILSDILLKKCIQFTIIALHFHKGLFWLCNFYLLTLEPKLLYVYLNLYCYLKCQNNCSLSFCFKIYLAF